jgi:hypothetical protein
MTLQGSLRSIDSRKGLCWLGVSYAVQVVSELRKLAEDRTGLISFDSEPCDEWRHTNAIADFV